MLINFWKMQPCASSLPPPCKQEWHDDDVNGNSVAVDVRSSHTPVHLRRARTPHSHTPTHGQQSRPQSHLINISRILFRLRISQINTIVSNQPRHRLPTPIAHSTPPRTRTAVFISAESTVLMTPVYENLLDIAMVVVTAGTHSLAACLLCASVCNSSGKIRIETPRGWEAVVNGVQSKANWKLNETRRQQKAKAGKSERCKSSSCRALGWQPKAQVLWESQCSRFGGIYFSKLAIVFKFILLPVKLRIGQWPF